MTASEVERRRKAKKQNRGTQRDGNKGELKGKGGRQAGKPKVDDDIIMLKNVLGLHVES